MTRVEDRWSSTAVTRAGGLSYRRLDYWARAGYLRPEGNNDGCGSRRRWPPDEIEIALLMNELTIAGFTVPKAAEIARAAIQSGVDRLRLDAADGGYIIGVAIERRVIE